MILKRLFLRAERSFLHAFGQKGWPLEIKVLPIKKWVKKTENLSKIIQAAIFGMFCSQY